MSFVWNVVLSFSSEEFWEEDAEEASETCAALEKINAWIPDGELVDLTHGTFAPGAGYGMTSHLYGGGFKHFDIEAFLSVVAAQDWKDRANVQLYLKSDADDCFTYYCMRPTSDAEEQESTEEPAS